QQDIVLITDLAQPLQIALGRWQHAGRTGQRLNDNRRNVGGIVQGDQLQQLLGLLGTALGHATGESVLGKQGVWQMISVDSLTKQGAVGANPTQADTAKVDPVIALRAPNQLGLAGPALLAPVGAGNFQRGIGALRAGTG